MPSMEREDWNAFVDTIKENVRSHAGYFTWLSDRDIEEGGVVQSLHESLAHSNEAFFHSYQSRGRGNDPPDCEAHTFAGGRIGIEVTELVDGASIAAVKAGAAGRWEPFSERQLFDLLAQRIAKKDQPNDVKGGPYDQYLLIIYCDEPRALDVGLIEYARRAVFPRAELIDRAFLLFSYSPWEGYCPYIELTLNDD